PEVLINIPSPFPFSTTFVSPAIMWTPAFSAAFDMDDKILRKSSIGSPSSIINPVERQYGRAPTTDRSLTVPLTASSPIVPPGKKSGETTYESVVKASLKDEPSTLRSPLLMVAESPSSLMSNSGTKHSAINWCISLPPLPCPSRILSILPLYAPASFSTGEIFICDPIPLEEAPPQYILLSSFLK